MTTLKDGPRQGGEDERTDEMRPRRAIAAGAVMMLGASVAAVPSSATTPGHNGLIVASLETGAGIQLFTVRPDGTQLRKITDIAGEAVNADWSSNGRHLVFELSDPEHAGIAIVRRDGSGLRDLTPEGFQGHVDVWLELPRGPGLPVRFGDQTG